MSTAFFSLFAELHFDLLLLDALKYIKFCLSLAFIGFYTER